MELGTTYRSKNEAAKARGWTRRQVETALRIAVLVPIVLPVDRKGAPMEPKKRS